MKVIQTYQITPKQVLAPNLCATAFLIYHVQLDQDGEVPVLSPLPNAVIYMPYLTRVLFNGKVKVGDELLAALHI